MPSRRETFRIAVRKFGPFESAIEKQWASFCATTGCTLRLEAEPLDLHPLHDTLFARQGLKKGNWDAAFIVTDWIAEAHATHALLDLAPHIAAQPPADFPHGWTDSLLRYQRFDKAILGLPYHDGPECLIYRKDLFDAAGLQPPRTWHEFHATARLLTKASANQWGTVFAAYPDGHNTVYDFCLQLWTRGGELFDTAGRLYLNTPAAEAALAFYREMLTDSSATHPKSRELDSVQSGFAFARGEVAMMVNWFGFAAMGETLADSAVKGRVAVAPLPAAPGSTSASLNVYWTLGIGSGSPHAKIAYDFLRHCASAENDKLLTLEGAIGCRKSTWHDADVNRVIPFYRELEKIHAHARELPRLAHWSELSAVIDRLVTSAVDTDESIPSLLARAQQEANALTA
ncbi:ABC transporter substrate-binding protein [Nibricoccus aquaticus]|uniref:ABC transporter substrate-binding protein n=1 Tax=Nibricoccus aquaticus TaxID=2576891 RepID=A0A290Q4D4_9BACT|nr:extracellular solute-binding protein [Nibricoccus aquaticus]ATC63344.1 ABC transporter substrate-binding protein [Nibricoccus aquaticus]